MVTDLMLIYNHNPRYSAKYRNQRQRTIDIDMTIIDMQKVIIELMIIMQKITGIQMTEDTQIAVDHQMMVDI
jgi:hypothetical protein